MLCDEIKVFIRRCIYYTCMYMTVFRVFEPNSVPFSNCSNECFTVCGPFLGAVPKIRRTLAGVRDHPYNRVTLS